MPGQFQLSVDQLVIEARQAHAYGVSSVLLFGIPAKKDERGSGAYAKDGIVQQAVAALKEALPNLVVTTDVCLCEYTDHGHCGIVKTRGRGKSKAISNRLPLTEGDFEVENDASVKLLVKIALSQAKAGADMIAPSDMMDGTVGAIRLALDAEGFSNLPIMAYSAKYNSAFYGPFREAAKSAPGFGDRRSYQMDPANAEEALREVGLDIAQGADIVMIKPALAYLDIIYRVKERFGHPVAAYNVSGEYAMVKAAGSRGWIDERPVWLEMLLGIKRAGADLIITYWAKEAARVL